MTPEHGRSIATNSKPSQGGQLSWRTPSLTAPSLSGTSFPPPWRRLPQPTSSRRIWLLTCPRQPQPWAQWPHRSLPVLPRPRPRHWRIVMVVLALLWCCCGDGGNAALVAFTLISWVQPPILTISSNLATVAKLGDPKCLENLHLNSDVTSF